MWMLLVLAGLLLLLTSFAVWVNRVALNTDVFTDHTSALLEDDAIRAAVATTAVDQLYESVDVEAEVEDQLPEDFKSLSGPAAAGLRQVSYEVIDRALERPALQRLFARAVEQSHRTLVDVLEGDTGFASTEGGVVTLNLDAIVLETADRIGIRSQIEDRLPEDVGRIEVLRSDELETAQNGFQLLKTLAWVLPVLMLAALGGAVLVARDRRRAVRGFGIVAIVVGVLGLVAVGAVGTYVVNSLVEESETRDAARNAWDILTELLRGSSRSYIAVGIMLIVAAMLSGPGRRALSVRRWIAPVVRPRLWPYLTLALVALVVLATRSIIDFNSLLLIVLLVGLGSVWIEVLHAQTLREFPDAEGPAVFGEAWGRITGWWEQLRAAPPTLPTAPRPPAGTPDVAERLSRLADLHARGALTDAEYADAKARVLAGD